MIARMKVCVEKGFDGVEFDNVEDYDNPTGFPITEGESAYYTAWMANQAHTMGLSTSWENAPTIVAALEPYMEALLFESCYNHKFCQKSAPMIAAGKWVGGVEYKADFKDIRSLPGLRKGRDGRRIQGACAQVVSRSMRYTQIKSHGRPYALTLSQQKRNIMSPERELPASRRHNRNDRGRSSNCLPPPRFSPPWELDVWQPL